MLYKDNNIDSKKNVKKNLLNKGYAKTYKMLFCLLGLYSQDVVAKETKAKETKVKVTNIAKDTSSKENRAKDIGAKNISAKNISELRSQIEDYGDLLRQIDKNVVQLVAIDGEGNESAGCGIVWASVPRDSYSKKDSSPKKTDGIVSGQDAANEDTTYIILTKSELLNNAASVMVRHLDKEYQGVIIPTANMSNASMSKNLNITRKSSGTVNTKKQNSSFKNSPFKNNAFSVALIVVKAPEGSLSVAIRSKPANMGLGRRIVLRGAYADTDVPITSFGYIVGDSVYTASSTIDNVTTQRTMHALQITAHTTAGCAGAGVFNTNGELIGMVQNVIGLAGKEGEGAMMITDSAVVMPVDMIERIISGLFTKKSNNAQSNIQKSNIVNNSIANNDGKNVKNKASVSTTTISSADSVGHNSTSGSGYSSTSGSGYSSTSGSGYSYLGLKIQSLEGLRDVLGIPQFAPAKVELKSNNGSGKNKADKEKTNRELAARMLAAKTLSENVNKSGVLVSEVIKDSPAYKAGIKSGDVIVRINDEYIDSTVKAQVLLSKIYSGSLVKIAILSKENKYKAIDIKEAQTANVNSMSESITVTTTDMMSNDNNSTKVKQSSVEKTSNERGKIGNVLDVNTDEQTKESASQKTNILESDKKISSKEMNTGAISQNGKKDKDVSIGVKKHIEHKKNVQGGEYENVKKNIREDVKGLNISKISYLDPSDKTPGIGYILHELPNATYMETERALQVGDIILSIDNIRPKTISEVEEKLSQPGKRLLYTLRNGKNKFFTVAYVG